MTNPIDPTPETAESAAQYRVSAQELSHVVTVIQARKEAEARQRANTVALGDAVEQLGLEMSPEELLAEIQADRNRRSRGGRPARRQSAERRTFATFAVCVGLAGMMAGSIHMHHLNRQMWESRNNPMFLASGFPAEPAPTVPTQIMTDSTLDMPVAETAPTSVSVYRPLEQFDENQIADCDFESLQALANGTPQSQVLVTALGPQEDKLWGIEKRNGEVLVYVYSTRDEALKAMNGHPAHVYASLHDGLTERLLPLKLFKNAELVDTPGRSGAMLNAESPFADVAPTHWAYQAVEESAAGDRVVIMRDRQKP